MQCKLWLRDEQINAPQKPDDYIWTRFCFSSISVSSQNITNDIKVTLALLYKNMSYFTAKGTREAQADVCTKQSMNSHSDDRKACRMLLIMQIIKA